MLFSFKNRSSPRSICQDRTFSFIEIELIKAQRALKISAECKYINFQVATDFSCSRVLELFESLKRVKMKNMVRRNKYTTEKENTDKWGSTNITIL